MIKLYSEDIEIIRELSKRKEVDAYFFHEKYMLSPAQLLKSIKKLREEGIIIFEEKILSLTDKGKIWVMANRKQLFLQERSKYWKQISKEVKQERMMKNELYKPKKKNIDSELFKNIEDGS